MALAYNKFQFFTTGKRIHLPIYLFIVFIAKKIQRNLYRIENFSNPDRYSQRHKHLRSIIPKDSKFSKQLKRLVRRSPWMEKLFVARPRRQRRKR